jgi:hypothetical protein
MFLRIIFFLTLLLTSCVREPDINNNFQMKYGEEVERLKVNRNLQGSQIISASSSVPSQAEILSAEGDFQPYVDIAKFGEKSPQEGIQRNETYDLSKTISDAGLDPDVFDLNYNLASHLPFRRIGIEFDNIKIPKVDAYGVETEIAAKTYITPGGNALQKTVDSINENKDEDDLRNSYALVGEKKKLARKRKMEKIFGAYDEMGVKVGEDR